MQVVPLTWPRNGHRKSRRKPVNAYIRSRNGYGLDARNLEMTAHMHSDGSLDQYLVVRGL